MSSLSLKSLVKRYNQLEVVGSVSLDVREGEFVSLLGPSGCGKTTILRMVAGLLNPTSGQILIDGQDVGHLPTNKRKIGLVFQSYALFPHLTVFENVAFGLRRQRLEGQELKKRVNEALERVFLGQHSDRYPKQLSGGQQQRVALARSIAPRPRIMLFDEPLSNLDAQLRDEMGILLKRLQSDLKMTSLFVTHDQHEAMSLSDRICLLANGHIQQYGSPEDVYFKPANGFVAGFIGRPNKFSGTIRKNGDRSAVELAPDLRLGLADASLSEGTKVDVTVRQEGISLSKPDDGPSKVNAVQAEVVLRIFAGPTVQYLLRAGQASEFLVAVPVSHPLADVPQGAKVVIGIDPANIFTSPSS